jgi:hypothetical protein
MNSVIVCCSVILMSMISFSCTHPAASSRPEPEKVGLGNEAHGGIYFEVANIGQSRTKTQPPDSPHSARRNHTLSSTDQAAHLAQGELFKARTQILSSGQIKVVGAAFNNFGTLSLEDREDIVSAILGENLNHVPVISVDKAWPDYDDIVKIVIGDYDLVFVRDADTERLSLYKMQKYYSHDLLSRHTIWELQERGDMTRHYLRTRPIFRSDSGKSGVMGSLTEKGLLPEKDLTPVGGREGDRGLPESAE